MEENYIPIRIPKKTKKKLVVNVDSDIFEFLKRSAEKSHCTVTDVVQYLLRASIEQASGPQPGMVEDGSDE